MGINYTRASAPYSYTFPTPSAPPMPDYEPAPRPSAPPAEKAEDPNGVCTICFEGNSTQVEKNKPHVIVAGKCMHFFHESCLKPLMAAKKNDGTPAEYANKCPSCRGKINLKELVVVDLTKQAPKPNLQPTRNFASEELTVEDQKALNKECAICLDVVNDHPNSNTALPRDASILKCGHAFHKYCIQAHVNNGLNTDCPTCRAPIDRNRIKVIDCSKMRLPTAVATPVVEQPQAMRQNIQSVSQGEGLTLGGALMGILRRTGKALQFGGKVIGAVVNEALKPDLPDRQEIIYATWKNFNDNNSKELRKLNSSLENNLTYSVSIRYEDNWKAKARFNAIEKATQNFIKEVRAAQDKLAQVLEAEAKNL